ncbi:unnamed protein product [Paramecium sonneborni]|uniref:CMP/dCMP-type deaminase domain-containing protein n=1 Tax=Paramecium sonneborni TaxID=65129 RepID=A0A8S1MUT5_9CILI|nr:unnamed protein product [Paramecium sonneborni]
MELQKEDILKYMKLALEQAEIGRQNKEVPVGCVIVNRNNGEIIEKAHNNTNMSKNATQHCEIVSINRMSRDLEDCILFVTCEPCIMCGQALNYVKIHSVYYGCKNSRFGGNGTVLSLNKYPSFGGYLEYDCMKILQDFYEDGNENIEEQFRHRKKQKQ